ncbi:MAG: fructose-1,6-bisphosphate aldolase/phosphatase [Candidatus Aenigmatarchaeota archaeon]|nr:fructose-1,6-bisphosphatase [Candidatus Aenigmarchaeota archaeon]
MMKVTISVIKADIGSLVGHSVVHPKIIEIAKKEIANANKKKKIIEDFFVINCGDDLELIMTHRNGIDNKNVHGLAWNVFIKCAEEAKKMKLYGAGQDIISTAFSGNVRGLGPGIAEMEFEERGSDPIIIFMADKTEAGAWNLPLYKIFADPFNTAGLVIDPKVSKGFIFDVLDTKEGRKITLKTPEESYELLSLIGAPSRYVVKSVRRKEDNEIAAVSSTEKLSKMAGHYVGKDDPVLIVRAQSGFPAVGEVLEPFANPFLVSGWMRGSHHGPLMPVSFSHAKCTRFDGPPRVIAAGFQVANGKLLGPVDLFDDPGFDYARNKANKIANYMRMHGPFEPHRLPLEDLEYTTYPEIEKKLKDRWKKI